MARKLQPKGAQGCAILSVMNAIFSGLKVIDCASVIAAPTAAMMLGDFGADVIKIEQPGDGDMLRMLSLMCLPHLKLATTGFGSWTGATNAACAWI